MRIAAIANAGASHQMTMCAIGRELQQLGHEFILLGTEFQAEQLKLLPQIPFRLVGDGRRDPARRYVERAREHAELPISATIEYMKSVAVLWCDEAPTILIEKKIQFLLADQEEPGAATAAELAGLPYASICSSLPLNDASDIPPGFLDWRYSSSLFAQVRNRCGYSIRNAVIRGINGAINTYRQHAGLRPYRRPDDSFSVLAQITQLVKEFDFPRKELPMALHYVGPFQRQALSTVDFPFDRLDGRPLIYTSFGTAFGTRLADLRAIAEACSSLPVQLVISLGGFEPGSEHNGFLGNPIVVRYAPQRALLSRASLAITHAGLNTALEALSLGVPLLALPIAGDQFGVAARIRYHGTGLTLGRKQRSVEQLKTAISSLLQEPQWSVAARRLQAAISKTGGAVEAAGIIDIVAHSARVEGL
jgi:zeaxanthin glucosyltransferase